MSKKKKTLRAAVLASIFAMAFSATAWADTVGTASPANISKNGYYFVNPTLSAEDGTVSGTTNTNDAAYGYDYNYYLQYHEAKDTEGKGYLGYNESGHDHWDTIIGLKLVVGGEETNTVTDGGVKDGIIKTGYIDPNTGQEIILKGVQLQHVRYTAGGEEYSPDHAQSGSIYLGKWGANEAGDANSTHYCGESAQSITVGQIQRMNEIYLENDKAVVGVLRGLNTNYTDLSTKVNSGWNFQVEENTTQNVQMGNTVTFDSIDANLIINNEGKTIKFDFSDTPTFNTVTVKEWLDAKNINAETLTVEKWLDAKDINTETLTVEKWLDAKDINTETLTVEKWLDAKDINTETLTVEKWLDAKNINAETLTVEKWLDAKDINTETLTVEEWLETNYATVKEDLAVGNHISTKTIEATTSVTTPTIVLGQPSSTTNVTYDNTVNNGRITYVDAKKNIQQVANLNDGLYYAGDTSTDEVETPYAKLNKTVKIYGGATKFTENDNIGVETTQNGDNVEMKVRLAKDIAGLNSVESDKVNVNNTLTVGDTNTNITVTKDTININNKTQITENGININNKVIVEENKVDVGGNRIENVADGVNPTDAVNVRQLDKLGNRVDKVGAGAAALAALHPLDFDPDDKLSFSAGVGNYGGETASALGMFYRPTEKVMLSAAGTMGNGENMVNMGVTFALDRKNNVSNSRVAMAREIQDLREQVAALTALVTQLAGRNNPVLMDTVMFPDVPENHWAYDYIEGLQKRGVVEGYPDGNFGGDRSMTRYEYAAMLYRALEKGFPVDSRLLDEFDAELGRIRIDRIKGLDDDGNKIERVRVNQYEGRDDYGSKLTTVNEAE